MNRLMSNKLLHPWGEFSGRNALLPGACLKASHRSVTTTSFIFRLLPVSTLSASCLQAVSPRWPWAQGGSRKETWFQNRPHTQLCTLGSLHNTQITPCSLLAAVKLCKPRTESANFRKHSGGTHGSYYKGLKRKNKSNENFKAHKSFRKLDTRNANSAENFFNFLPSKNFFKNVIIIVLSTMYMSRRGNSHKVLPGALE